MYRRNQKYKRRKRARSGPVFVYYEGRTRLYTNFGACDIWHVDRVEWSSTGKIRIVTKPKD